MNFNNKTIDTVLELKSRYGEESVDDVLNECQLELDPPDIVSLMFKKRVHIKYLRKELKEKIEKKQEQEDKVQENQKDYKKLIDKIIAEDISVHSNNIKFLEELYDLMDNYMDNYLYIDTLEADIKQIQKSLELYEGSLNVE